MDLAESKEHLRKISVAVPSGQWDKDLTSAVQRALAEFFLLNPNDDVDGDIGPRTRDAWKFFQEATGQVVSDTIDKTSAGVLLDTLDNSVGLIGRVKVALQPDFEFRRKQSTANQATSARAIIQAAQDRQLTKAQIAYILATAEHESDSFNTLEEYSKGNQYEGRGDLGNTHPGDGVRFKGRGYVQLTGRLNYTRYSQITGLDLIKLPIILMNRAALSVFVIVDGMMLGVYTRRRLDEFVNNQKQDFFNARQVVNGHDRADKIAAQADDWLKNLA
jgi:peptidoglycan hydrolase-like protein with peptidoglycan-binding domain